MKILSILLMSLLCFQVSSCKKNKKEKCSPPETISYSKDIQPIFTENCISCHSGTSPDGNLNLNSTVSYNNLMNPQSGYVDTVNPTSSLLYNYMNSGTNPMPPTGKLDECNIELVLKWIEQKAKNN